MLEKRKKDKWLGDFGGMRIEFSTKDLYLDIVEEEQEKTQGSIKKEKEEKQKTIQQSTSSEPVKMVEFPL